MELIENLINNKHDLLSYKEAKNRRGCDDPGIGKNPQTRSIAV